MTALPGTNVAAKVVPFTDADGYPTHDALYGKGGWREVDTAADRDAIATERLSDGMVVWVREDKIAYQYQDSDGTWQALAVGCGGGSDLNWKGTWSSTTAYEVGDAVARNGSSYIAIASSRNQVPPNSTYWDVLARAGSNGLLLKRASS